MNRIVLAIAGFALVTSTALPAAAEVAPASAGGTTGLCGVAQAGYATCYAQLLSGANRPTDQPSGLGAAALRSAYNLSRHAGGGKTVAIVTAYDDPTALSDLATYRATYQLAACTWKNRCFRKVNQRGGSYLPKANANWAVETSIDIEMVAAACPRCNILIVEADTSSMVDLGDAVNYAATQHVAAISNSYGSTDMSQSSAFNHPGIAVVAAAGDTGYGAGAPAAFSTVIAVGGTTLHRANNARGWSETAWSGGGSFCAHSAKPRWQTGTSCAGKVVSDVSAVADPNTGVAVYVGTKFDGDSGWQVSGGTSVAAPIIAAVYAMSRRTAEYPAAYTWAHAHRLNDIWQGSNGKCSISRWCQAGKGWDGPTGLGTPNGTSGF
jgi:subtilase family serine protease